MNLYYLHLCLFSIPFQPPFFSFTTLLLLRSSVSLPLSLSLSLSLSIYLSLSLPLPPNVEEDNIILFRVERVRTSPSLFLPLHLSPSLSLLFFLYFTFLLLYFFTFLDFNIPLRLPFHNSYPFFLFSSPPPPSLPLLFSPLPLLSVSLFLSLFADRVLRKRRWYWLISRG